MFVQNERKTERQKKRKKKIKKERQKERKKEKKKPRKKDRKEERKKELEMFLPITRAAKGVREAHICHILKDILFFLSGVAEIGRAHV